MWKAPKNMAQYECSRVVQFYSSEPDVFFCNLRIMNKICMIPYAPYSLFWYTFLGFFFVYSNYMRI